MAKKLFLIFVLMIAVTTSGCYKPVICNEPYIFVGSECCLDKNKNQICDKDEIGKNINTTKTLMDLQKTISSIFSKDLLLSKDVLYNNTQFYSHKDNLFIPISSCTSGCAGSVYVDRVNLDKVSVGYIIRGPPITEHQFYDYISENKNHFLNQIKEIKTKFENNFNTSDGLTRYYEKKDFKIYPLANYTKTTDIIFDNITLLKEMSESAVIEIDYAAINDYNVNYGSKKIAGFINRRERQLDFLQAIVIYCRSDLIITLYGDRYDWRVLINNNIYKENVINQFEVNRKLLLPKAKLILDLCINKYSLGQFSIE